MGKTFARVHAASAGHFEHGDKIAQWVKFNGGQFSRGVHSHVTHLITSLDAYKQNVEAVKMAKKLGTVKIVTYDWLEDSLLQKSKRPKVEEPYLLENQFGPRAKSKSKRFGAKDGKQVVRDPFSQKKGTKVKERIYRDPDTSEEWSAYLFRSVKPGAPREKFSLAIFEDHRSPPSYSAYAKYSRTGTSDIAILSPPRSTLESAKDSLKKFFAQETGKKWDDRFDNKAPPPKKDADGNDLPMHEGWYSVEYKRTLLGSYMMEPVHIPPKEPSVVPREPEHDPGKEDANGAKGRAESEFDSQERSTIGTKKMDGSSLFEH
ncbi:hypothetical protein N7470_009667 [Penicillium chermesinum]|nr:hypothetical protein N7470_009667 [Penicillium chermesinum]